MSFSISKNFGGYDISAQSFYSTLSEDLNANYSKPCRSSICEARQKLSWEVFPHLLKQFNKSIETELDKMKWHGHHVYAADGSILTLSHSEELKQRFPDKDSGSGKTHYPKARIVIATHVLSGIPKTLRIEDQFIGERKMLQNMLCEFEDNSILLLDRGFDGINSLNKIIESKKSFICRLRSELWSSSEVYLFAKSEKEEAVVTLRNKHKEEITVRLLKFKKDRNGNAIVLATNLIDTNKYSRVEMWELYSRRWDVETSYYRIKKLFRVEKFHAKKLNGILQEIWASLIAFAMTAYLVVKSWPDKMKGVIKSKKAPNFKNATVVLQKNFTALLYLNAGKKLNSLVAKILRDISSVIFSRQFGRKNPRISKQSLSTWVGGRKNKTKNRIGRSKIRRGIYA